MKNYELRLPYTIPKCSVPVHYFPHTVQIQHSWLSPHAQPYTDNSHCHNDLDCCNSKLVSHSLLELWKRKFFSRHSIM